MVSWHCATVAALCILTLGELVGGYFAFRPTIVTALGPNDIFQAFRIKRWMYPWLVPWVPSGETASMPEYDRHFRWRPHWPSGPFLLVRFGVRVAVGVFFLVKVSIHGAPY
ncbi:MAG: hypothetical protein OXG61_05065 [Chloroflexi bacterium]|nr:hypothetical protein [Chloroflexota bacterium]